MRKLQDILDIDGLLAIAYQAVREKENCMKELRKKLLNILESNITKEEITIIEGLIVQKLKECYDVFYRLD